MDRLELYARLSREAYRRISCDADALARMRGVQAWIPGYCLLRSTELGSGAFSIRTDTRLILVFRGTETPRDMFLDAEVLPARFVAPGGSWEVHGGFLRAWDALAPWVRSQQPFGQYTDLVVCGHSLGGAIATLAGMELRAQDAYTYGSPKVSFGRDFTDAYAELGPETSRIVHDVDLVPQLPPGMYQHVCEGEFLTDLGSWITEPPMLERDLADLDGRALADHHVDQYVQACALLAARDTTPIIGASPCVN
jgi:hypothetical protein